MPIKRTDWNFKKGVKITRSKISGVRNQFGNTTNNIFKFGIYNAFL